MRFLLPRVAAFSVVAVCAAIAAHAWATRQYSHEQEILTAHRFVELLRDQNYDSAFELTTKSKVWGYDGESFHQFAPRQLCGQFSVTEVFPFQSNGNRIKRWVRNETADMPEVNVQYSGSCFFRVTLRRVANGDWQVLKFGSHAG
jgi:hypothetical protein